VTNWACLGIAAVLAAATLDAQGPGLEVVGIGGGLGLRTAAPGYTDRVTGTVAGVEGRALFGKTFLDLSYLDGTLGPGGSPASRDVVDGRADAGIRPAQWLTIGGGAHLRAYATGAATERWVLWEVRARAALSLINRVARGDVELWRALGATVNIPQPFAHAQGGAVGLTIQPPATPWQVGLDYQVDDVEFGGAGPRQTLEAVTVRLGWAIP